MILLDGAVRTPGGPADLRADEGPAHVQLACISPVMVDRRLGQRRQAELYEGRLWWPPGGAVRAGVCRPWH
ncbi:hypothetical protein SRO_7462 [Streptomyces rochei]|nr:hypothetical protein SRO_7462 [Streptomyces rochei]